MTGHNDMNTTTNNNNHDDDDGTGGGGGEIGIVRSTSSTVMEENNDIEGDTTTNTNTTSLVVVRNNNKKIPFLDCENITDDDDNDDVCVYMTAVANRQQGQDQDNKIINNNNNKKEQFRQSLVTSQMLSHKQHGSYDMAEDVYAFIVAAPIFSWSFLFASYVIATKYIVYATLLNGIYFKELGGADPAATAVKFFLIPVAIAMQSDLMAVYEYLANVRYDKEVLTISSHATFTKFVLAYILRLADGVLSLSVNFGVMLVTDEVLGVFLNFAALHFLQDIDDVFYSLVEKGFFGDRLEHMATICKQISWPRRVGNEDCWKSSFITSLDTILFTTTLVILLSMFIAITVRVEQGKSILGYDLEGEE